MLVRHEPSSAAVVRRTLAADLAGRGIDADSIDEIVLVASELVGNAVRHTTAPAAAQPLDVTWTVDAAGVTVWVADPSTDVPRPRVPGNSEPGGRGLTIIAAVADDWGVKRLASGKRVWAHVPVGRVPAG